jgi:ferredoxin-nitrite reductase
MNVPVGRLQTIDLFEFARLAETYGQGEVRFTVEQNVILPHIPDEKLSSLLAEPLLKKFSIDPLPLERAVVSCTGAQFCNFALIETKQRAIQLARELDQRLELPRPVRIHWTGCPNSCGQPQVADIGLMGSKVKKNGQMVDGVDLYMGGKVGKDAQLGTCVRKGIPCDELLDILQQILIQDFGAQLRTKPTISSQSQIVAIN